MKTSEAYSQGCKDERERIVAWLLGQQQGHSDTAVLFYAKLFADGIAEQEYRK